jgi:hypothetical protein
VDIRPPARSELKDACNEKATPVSALPSTDGVLTSRYSQCPVWLSSSLCPACAGTFGSAGNRSLCRHGAFQAFCAVCHAHPLRVQSSRWDLRSPWSRARGRLSALWQAARLSRRRRRAASIQVYLDLEDLGQSLRPLFAGTLAESKLALDQSISPSLLSSSSSTQCNRRRTPALCRSLRRLQHVTPLPNPNPFGNIPHGMPLFRT